IASASVAVVIGLALVFPRWFTEHLRSPRHFDLSAVDRDTLENADTFEVFRILDMDEPGTFDSKERPLGFYRVVKRSLVPPGERAKLVASLYDAIDYDWLGARCFSPHHGVRAAKSGRSIELVICYMCNKIQLGGGTYLPTSSHSKDALEALLR